MHGLHKLHNQDDAHGSRQRAAPIQEEGEMSLRRFSRHGTILYDLWEVFQGVGVLVFLHSCRSKKGQRRLMNGKLRWLTWHVRNHIEGKEGTECD